MTEKTIEQMVTEVSDKNWFSTRDDHGFSGVHVEKTIPSSKKTAIVYQTAGSNWNREGPYGGGISYFQGTRVYNGKVDLVVKPHTQWRCGRSYANDAPWNRYFIKNFEDLEEGKYRLVLINDHGPSQFLVDFDRGTVKEE